MEKITCRYPLSRELLCRASDVRYRVRGGWVRLACAAAGGLAGLYLALSAAGLFRPRFWQPLLAAALLIGSLTVALWGNRLFLWRGLWGLRRPRPQLSAGGGVAAERRFGADALLPLGGGIFIRPEAALQGWQEGGEVKLRWLRGDVCAVTYRGEDRQPHAAAFPFGEGESRPLFEQLEGRWQSDSGKFSLTYEGGTFQLRRGGGVETYPIANCKKVERSAAVLFDDRGLPRWIVLPQTPAAGGGRGGRRPSSSTRWPWMGQTA